MRDTLSNHLSHALSTLTSATILCGLVGTAASQTINQLPPVTLELSADGEGGTFFQDLEVPTSFVTLRCTADPAVAGGWHGTLFDAWTEDSNYLVFGDFGPQMEPPTPIPFQLIANHYAENSGYETHPDIHARPEEILRVLNLGLYTNGARDPVSPLQMADPLFRNPNGIVQIFGLHRGQWVEDIQDDWVPSTEGLEGFNVDALTQRAVWRRVRNAWGGDYQSFFASSEWEKMTTLNITLGLHSLVMRGADVVTENVPFDENGGTPPLLEGYPTRPVKLTTSVRATVTFVGTTNPERPRLQFHAEWGAPLNSVQAVQAGQSVRREASGARPGMKLRLRNVHNSQEFYDVTPTFADFGEISIPIPFGIPPGTTLEVQKYAYRYPVGLAFGFTAWIPVTIGHRPRFVLQ
ncbi:MAG: hypothetical protein R3F56_24475 [Planctomycetota bacterium]